MGYLRKPAYYDRFRCIASSCTDTCCAGWEIDIDDETLEKYRQVKEPFAQRLWEQIELSEEDDGEPAHFRLAAHDRCPFLNDRNLCEIYTHLGEDHLSYICTHHPRFYEWYTGGREAGLGLVCEAAADLILQPKGTAETAVRAGGSAAAEFITMEDDGPEDVLLTEDEDLLLQRELEERMFSMRERLFRLIGAEGDFEEKCGRVWREAQRIQREYDALLWDNDTDRTAAEADNGNVDNGNADDAQLPSAAWAETFWTESYLEKLLDFYLHLEVNDPAWAELLRRMKKRLPEILAGRAEFSAVYADHAGEYDRLLTYFIYRYFMKARYDGELQERVKFALISTGMVRLTDIYHYMEYGMLTHREQIDICKMYAKEIEYDEGNVDELTHYGA